MTYLGLRPGEKLYEELLVKTEELDKTENSMIFIERDTALSQEEIEEKMRILREACDSGDNLIAKQAMRKVVPTFKSPEEVNCHVATAAEELNFRICGIEPGDEVIVPAYTYTASASAPIHCGAKVVFVDSQKDNCEMDYG